MADFSEKTIPATPRRRQQAREEGQVAVSADVTSAALLLAGLGTIVVLGYPLLSLLAGLMSDSLSGAGHVATDVDGMASMLSGLAWRVLGKMAPIMALAAGAALFMGLLQTGFLFLPSLSAPKFDRINPARGLSRIASPQGAVRMTIGVLKVAVVVAVAYGYLYSRRGDVAAAGALDAAAAAKFLWDLCLATCFRAGLALAALAGLDYAYQWWRRERDLRMTPQELREEMREMQGNPQTLARRRTARGLGTRARVAFGGESRGTGTRAPVAASLLIMGAGGIVVAIGYDPTSTEGPKIVARGSGATARRLRQTALRDKTPVVTRDDLARSLWQSGTVGAPIAATHYSDVAEALAATGTAD